MQESFSEGKKGGSIRWEERKKRGRERGKDRGRKHTPLNDCRKSKSEEVLEREQKLPAGARPSWAMSPVCIVRVPLHLWQMPARELWAFPELTPPQLGDCLSPGFLLSPLFCPSLERLLSVHEKGSVDYLLNEPISKIGVRSVAADCQGRDLRT